MSSICPTPLSHAVLLAPIYLRTIMYLTSHTLSPWTVQPMAAMPSLHIILSCLVSKVMYTLTSLHTLQMPAYLEKYRESFDEILNQPHRIILSCSTSNQKIYKILYIYKALWCNTTRDCIKDLVHFYNALYLRIQGIECWNRQQYKALSILLQGLVHACPQRYHPVPRVMPSRTYKVRKLYTIQGVVQTDNRCFNQAKDQNMVIT